jgi:hypothetical protein
MKTKRCDSGHGNPGRNLIFFAPTAAQSLCGAREAVVDMLGTLWRNGAQLRPGRTRQNRRGVRVGRDRVVDHSRHQYRGVACLVASGQHYEQVDRRCPMVRLSDGWSLPLGLSAAPSPPC